MRGEVISVRTVSGFSSPIKMEMEKSPYEGIDAMLYF